jgi:alpha-beta hydrolase superfamily lysophospholipase
VAVAYVLAVSGPHRTTPEWTADRRLDGYETLTIDFPDDEEGAVVATLVRRADHVPRKRAVLYLHGYNDYFFQSHVADRLMDAGYAFVALDLRKHGRSLLPHQKPNYCADFSEYYPDVTAALEVLLADGAEDVAILGHSTGALVACLYTLDGTERRAIDALVLNSPFLEHRGSLPYKGAIRVLDQIARLMPNFGFHGVFPPLYGTSLHREYRGTWRYDLDVKPLTGFPLYVGWLRASLRGHARVKAGLGLEPPILTLCSDRSVNASSWTDALFESDAVLDIQDIRRLAPRLGANVEVFTVPRAVHDVFLSRPEPLELALSKTVEWLDAHL